MLRREYLVTWSLTETYLEFLHIVLDQFIRNNWDNSRLVPKKEVKHIMHDKVLEVYREDDVREMSNVPYFKMRKNGVDTLWRQTGKSGTAVYYEEITPLGNNGEYLEMSNSNIVKAANIPAVAKEQSSDSQIATTSNQVVDTETPSVTAPTKVEENGTQELLYQVLENGKTVTSREQAIAKAEEFKNKSEEEKKALEGGMKKFIKNRFEKLGIKYDANKIDEVFKVMC